MDARDLAGPRASDQVSLKTLSTPTFELADIFLCLAWTQILRIYLRAPICIHDLERERRLVLDLEPRAVVFGALEEEAPRQDDGASDREAAEANGREGDLPPRGKSPGHYPAQAGTNLPM